MIGPSTRPRLPPASPSADGPARTETWEWTRADELAQIAQELDARDVALLEQDITEWRVQLSEVGQQRTELQQQLAESGESSEGHGTLHRALLALDMSKQRLIWNIRESEQELRARRRRMGLALHGVPPSPPSVAPRLAPVPHSDPVTSRTVSRGDLIPPPPMWAEHERELVAAQAAREAAAWAEAVKAAAATTAAKAAAVRERALPKSEPDPSDPLPPPKSEPEVSAAGRTDGGDLSASQLPPRRGGRRVQFRSPHRAHPTRRRAYTLPPSGTDEDGEEGFGEEGCGEGNGWVDGDEGGWDDGYGEWTEEDVAAYYANPPLCPMLWQLRLPWPWLAAAIASAATAVATAADTATTAAASTGAHPGALAKDGPLSALTSCALPRAPRREIGEIWRPRAKRRRGKQRRRRHRGCPPRSRQ